MEQKDKVGIVIVNYNGAKFQNECIASILESDYDNYSIIVVDNASTDNSVELLSEFKDDRLIVIRLEENCGVAKGNNVGIQKSLELGCTHSLLLNNDTVVEKSFLSSMLACGEDIVSPKIYYYGTNKIWYCGGKFQRIKGTAKHLNYRIEDNGQLKSRYYEYAPTCCLLIKNEVFRNIGMIDENYFLYFDDTDFCYRAKLNGYKIWVDVNSVIYHKVGFSTGGDTSPVMVYYLNRNRFYYVNKFKLGFLTKLFCYTSRRLKILESKIKKTDDAYYIQLAINDYKNGKMFRRDGLIKR